MFLSNIFLVFIYFLPRYAAKKKREKWQLIKLCFDSLNKFLKIALIFKFLINMIHKTLTNWQKWKNCNFLKRYKMAVPPPTTPLEKKTFFFCMPHSSEKVNFLERIKTVPPFQRSLFTTLSWRDWIHFQELKI